MFFVSCQIYISAPVCLLAICLPAAELHNLNIIQILCDGSLVGNGVGSTGACALANIIKNSTSLEELW